MFVLKKDEYALLELVAMKPLSYLPPNHHQKAYSLLMCGLIKWDRSQWHPTKLGLDLRRGLFRHGGQPIPVDDVFGGPVAQSEVA
jgi:hypothetical protein